MNKIILIMILSVNLLYADPATLAYRCKMNNGAIGYYDHSCKYMADFNTGIFNGYKVIEETIVTLKSASKNRINNNIYAYKIDNKLSITKPTKTTKSSKKPIKQFTAMQLANKRCKNAIVKIPIIQELLNKQNNNQNNNQNNDDHEKILAKLKRSLARYKSIKNKYCIYQ